MLAKGEIREGWRRRKGHDYDDDMCDAREPILITSIGRTSGRMVVILLGMPPTPPPPPPSSSHMSSIVA